MKTAADLRAEAQHLRDIALYITDPRVLMEIEKMIEELERRARALGNGGLSAQADPLCLPCTPRGILIHNEVGYTMPTWPANHNDGEQKVAGERMLLRQVPSGLQILAPGRDETIPQPQDWVAGYPRAVQEALGAYGRGDRRRSRRANAHGRCLIFDAYRAAGVE